MQKNCLQSPVGFSIGRIVLFTLIAMPGATRAAAVREVAVANRYVAAGEQVHVKVMVDGTYPAPAGATLRVVEYRTVNIPATRAGLTGESSRIIFDKPLPEIPGIGAGTGAFSYEADAAGILAGKLRVKAEIIDPVSMAPLSSAWSDPIGVGFRRRISLAGDWDVTKIEPFSAAIAGRPKNWKLPETKSATLPGPLIHDEFFRGWVTVRRDVKWSKTGDLQPRFVRLSNVTDSAAVTVNGVALPESRPIEQLAVLSHWIEFHSKFKGEANAQTRLLFLDLWPQKQVKLALPEALAAEGSADIQIRVRGTSGSFRPHPLPAIRGDLHLDLTAPVYVKTVSFDTDKPGENRRFKFALALGNETGREFHGKLRAVYCRYDGKVPYTGNCPAYATVDQPIVLPAGASTIEVMREEKPRFDTCHATFFVLGDDDKVLDGDGIDFHTVTMEIRDRRDFYLNNERFIVKAQGSNAESPHTRFQFRVMGGNGIRGAGSVSPDEMNLFESEGLLMAGGPLLASVEKCVFFNPQDTSNIDRAVKTWVTDIGDCPGVILWEATNELHGEPEEARVAMLSAFHKFDPYHRPVFATKGSGEWEAEARDGRVAGVDVVGCQYLLSKEGVDSIAAAVTEQPIMSTEVNWNDISFGRDKLWQYWLDKGVAGSLLFDYSGRALDQPTPMVPPPDTIQDFSLIKQSNRDLYQDLVAGAAQQIDGSVLLRLGNQMPYALHDVSVRVRGFGKFTLANLAPGAAVVLQLPVDRAPAARTPVVVRAEYMTHGGLPHIAILTPTVSPAPAAAAVKGGGK